MPTEYPLDARSESGIAQALTDGGSSLQSDQVHLQFFPEDFGNWENTAAIPICIGDCMRYDLQHTRGLRP